MESGELPLSRFARSFGIRSARTLSDLYERRILPMAKKAFDGGGDSRGNRFQWPLLVAYLLWVLEMCLTDRRRP